MVSSSVFVRPPAHVRALREREEEAGRVAAGSPGARPARRAGGSLHACTSPHTTLLARWTEPPGGRCSPGLGRAGAHTRSPFPLLPTTSTDGPVELVGSSLPCRRECGSLGCAPTPVEKPELAHNADALHFQTRPLALHPFRLLEGSFMHSLGQSKYKSEV